MNIMTATSTSSSNSCPNVVVRRRTELAELKKQVSPVDSRIVDEPLTKNLMIAASCNQFKSKDNARKGGTRSLGKKRVSFHIEENDDECDDEPHRRQHRHEELSSRVRTEVLCLLKPSSEMTYYEKSSVWWQDSDFARFEMTAKMIGAEIRRRAAESVAKQQDDDIDSSSRGIKAGTAAAPSYAEVVGQALEACRRAAALDDDDGGCRADDDDDVEEDEARVPLPRKLLAYLTHWSTVGHSRRGLEKMSVSARRTHFRAHRKGTVRAVLEAQQKKKEEDDGAAAASSSDWETIRAASRMHSRSARMFSLAMGIADAAAVGLEAGRSSSRDKKVMFKSCGTRGCKVSSSRPKPVKGATALTARQA